MTKMYKGKQLFRVGKIVNTQGLKGELRIVPVTDFPNRFQSGSQFIIVTVNNEMIEVEVDKSRPHKNFVLLLLSGYNSINDVEVWKGSELFVTEDNLAELEDGEYYFHQLIGCHVQTDQQEPIGILTDILQTGANDVYVVKREGKKDLLLPVIDDCIKDVDIDKKLITAHMMSGLE